MEDGLRVEVSGNEVTIFQNAGDPDYPEDEIFISMSKESFQRIVAISEAAFGIKVKPKPAASEAFAAFWGEYPNKAAKDRAVRAWITSGAEQFAEEIMSALAQSKDSRQWLVEGGRFIPHAATWLNNRRWLEVEVTADLGEFK